MKKVLSFFTLFTSLGTILCCALPFVLVTLGLGASFASLTNLFPQITTITANKEYLFISSGILIVLSYYLYKKDLACQGSEDQKQACDATKRKTPVLLFTAASLYVLGFSFAYIFPLFL